MTDHEMGGGITAKGLEQVIMGGDLAQLSPGDRLTYYQRVCDSLGLNPLTQPFAYLRLSGKLTLYATRQCTDQIRALHKVSLQIVARDRHEDMYVVTAEATLPDGRTDASMGAVSLIGLKGGDLANAFMKAETKAKRRVTLSIVGLGWLDESEVDTIKDARMVPVDQNGVILAPNTTSTSEAPQRPASTLPGPSAREAPPDPATPVEAGEAVPCPLHEGMFWKSVKPGSRHAAHWFHNTPDSPSTCMAANYTRQYVLDACQALGWESNDFSRWVDEQGQGKWGTLGLAEKIQLLTQLGTEVKELSK